MRLIDTFSQAKEIIPGSYPTAPIQTHTLTSVASSDADLSTPTAAAPGVDIDWVFFKTPNAGRYYIIDTSNLKPAYTGSSKPAMDTRIELWRLDTAASAQPVRIDVNTDVYPTDPTDPYRSRIVYQSKNASSTGITGTPDDTSTNVTFFVKIYGEPGKSCTGSYNISINITTDPSVITPTPQPTATPTSTPGTSTPDPCHDIYEDDSNPTAAKELRVTYSPTPPFNGTPGAPDNTSTNNNVQSHTICPVGDQDWVYVDLVKGKAYSIFTSNLTNGLDTMLTLFSMDAQGNLHPLYANDDFPGMGLASRIDFVVPAQTDTPTGTFQRYYVNAKDVSGHGQPGMNYNLTLTAAGEGKGSCIDYYEPDGVPSDAKEILINESQNHDMCPTGDADWVKFFAKAGPTYSMRTHFGPIPGMDTSVFVFAITFDSANPTQVTSQQLLASNDDASVNDLSSQVSFVVPDDGVYYAQVKNEGDVGGEGFDYQLQLTLGNNALIPTATPQPATAGPTQGVLTPATISPTTGVTATATSTDLLPKNVTFADPAFQQLWSYSDLAVAQNQTQRSWEWGPKPGVVKVEAYSDSPGGTREVQYFDKSRMEINNPKGDRTNPWFVSNGLLVKEMITGQIATGDNTFDQRAPARLQVAGDVVSDNPAPTYAQFAPLITNGTQNRATDLTGQTITQGLANGSVINLDAPPEALKFSNYIQETGHNIPQVFYDYMTSHGTIYDNGYKQGTVRNWVFSMGYPLSEPYWIKAEIGGITKDVLVQVFERRILTYTPSNSADWQVEMANVGQHYYLWRYNRNLYEQ